MTDTMANQTGTATLEPVTLITGGSDGIGRALAELFAERGDQLLLAARNTNRLRIAADELEQKWGREVHIASVDLMQHGASSQLMHDIKESGFYVDHLINSAGISFSGSFSETDLGGVHALIQLNLTAPTNLMHICLRGMLERGTGGILNIASLAGLAPVPNLATYSASKSYLIALTRALAEELRHSGVNISVLLPGPVDTNFMSYSSERGAKLQRFIPISTPEAVARTGYEGYLARQTIITPGFFNMLYRLMVKILPYKILMRSVGAIYSMLFRIDG